MSTDIAPGVIERGEAFLGAARASDGDTRALYAAWARGAYTTACERLRVLRLNLEAVEADIAKGGDDAK